MLTSTELKAFNSLKPERSRQTKSSEDETTPQNDRSYSEMKLNLKKIGWANGLVKHMLHRESSRGPLSRASRETAVCACNPALGMKTESPRTHWPACLTYSERPRPTENLSKRGAALNTTAHTGACANTDTN